MARSFKDLGGMWFHLHRALQTLGFILGTVALGLGFELSGGWATETSSECLLPFLLPFWPPVCPACCSACKAAYLAALPASLPGCLFVSPSLDSLQAPHSPLLPWLCSPRVPAAEQTVHRNLGVACTVLAATQFSALILRPNPGTKYRFAWALWHSWAGRAVSAVGSGQ